MRTTSRLPGFTLIELMVSLAIALVLILGVNIVFRTTAQTVGAGNGLLAAARDARTVGATLLADFNTIDPVPEPISPTVGDAPCFIIRSQHIYAFRNASDFAEATNPTDPSTDSKLFANTTIFPNNQAPVPYIHFRSHRIDKLAFFIRGNLFRQTSSDANSYTSSTGSNEAWVVWGHGMQPNNAMITALTNNPGVTPASGGPAAWFGPGDNSTPGGPTNDNNYYASDWILTRSATLLVPKPSDPDYIVDPYVTPSLAGNPASGLQPLVGWPRTPTGKFTTLSSPSAHSPSMNGKTYTLDQSRLDIANTSIEIWGSPYRKNPASNVYDGIASYNPNLAAPYYNSTAVASNPDWWDPLINYRCQTSPYLLPDPNSTATTPKITPYGLALCAPALIRGCSQFIVEYAGNYYTKLIDGTANQTKNIGYSTATYLPITDKAGTLDFYSYTVAAPSDRMRGIRWYGYPRSVNPRTTGGVAPTVGLGQPKGTALIKSSNGDVIPLRDFLAASSPSVSSVGYIWAPPFTAPVSNPADAERFTPPTGLSMTTASSWPTVYSPAGGGISTDYWSSNNAIPSNDAAQMPNSASYPYTYTAAWGPDTKQPFPKMIRIIIGLDDHEGRLNQPQMFEYVFNVSP